jgi:hypothetical protein
MQSVGSFIIGLCVGCVSASALAQTVPATPKANGPVNSSTVDQNKLKLVSRNTGCDNCASFASPTTPTK